MQCISIPVCVEFIVALTQKNQSLGPILIGPHTHWKHSMVFHIIQRYFMAVSMTARLNSMYDVVLAEMTILF